MNGIHWHNTLEGVPSKGFFYLFNRNPSTSVEIESGSPIPGIFARLPNPPESATLGEAMSILLEFFLQGTVTLGLIFRPLSGVLNGCPEFERRARPNRLGGGRIFNGEINQSFHVSLGVSLGVEGARKLPPRD